MRALSNRDMTEELERLAILKAKALKQGAGAGPEAAARPARPLRLRSGVIQATVLEVLRASSGTLRAGEIHLRVQERLVREISRDTVISYLSVACRDETSGVRRFGYGRYGLLPS